MSFWHWLYHLQDWGSQCREAGDPVPALRGQAGADRNHHTVRGSACLPSAVHAVLRFPQQKTLPGQLNCVCVCGGGGATKCSTIISSEQGSYRLWQFRNLGKLRCLFLGLEIVWDNENFGHCLGKWEVHDFGDGLTDDLQTGDSERKVEAEWWKIQGKYKIDFTWNHTQTCSRSLSAATCGTSYCPWNRHAVAIGLGGWSPRLGILKQKSCLNPGLPQQKYSRLMQHVCVLICMSVSLVCILFRGPWTVCEGWQHLVLSQPPSVRGSTRFGPWANSVHIVLSAPLWLDMSPRVW